MLARFIIGGIALAATGYGLKRYIDKHDKYDVVEDVGFQVIDGIETAERETNKFFNYIVEGIDKYVDADKNDVQKDILKELYISKENFYNDTIPYFLDIFSKIKNLPDFDMEQFYKLQEKFEEENVDAQSLDEKTLEALKSYKKAFNNGIFVMESSLTNLGKRDEAIATEVDYNEYTKEQKTQLQNIYLIAIGLINFCYTDTLDADNKISNNLSRQLLMFRKLIKDAYDSLNSSQNSTSSI